MSNNEHFTKRKTFTKNNILLERKIPTKKHILQIDKLVLAALGRLPREARDRFLFLNFFSLKKKNRKHIKKEMSKLNATREMEQFKGFHGGKAINIFPPHGILRRCARTLEGIPEFEKFHESFEWPYRRKLSFL